MAGAISLQLDGFEELTARLRGIEPDKIVNEARDNTALEFDNTVRANIQERIYDKPQSLTYVRTGRAKKGSVIEDFEGGKRIRWDTTIADKSIKGVTGGLTKSGARKRSAKYQRNTNYNYSPMLNRNSRIKKLDTGFFDDVKDNAKEMADIQFQKSKNKFLK